MNPQFLTLILAATIGLSACSEAQVNSVSDNGASVDATASGPVPTVSINDAYVLKPLKGRDVTAGFFEVNGGDIDAKLVSASSPFVDTIELHTHTMDKGVMQMRKVDAIEIPAGETVYFKPGGLHLMLFGTRFADDQNAMPVTLVFEDGSTTELSMPLRDRS